MDNTSAGQTLISPGPAKLIDRRHPEWRRHHIRWKWLLDTLEGGDVYRNEIYGYDTALQPIRNLIRHPHEYPDPRQRFTYGPLGRPAGTDQYAQATDGPYELRRARTPAPTHLKRTLAKHLSKVFGQDAKRSGPPEVEAWWEDVDGARSEMRTWMRDVIAPLVLTLGQLDVICDHPELPEGVEPADIRTNADAEKYDLNRVVASYILPENILWWKLNARGEYLELLIEEPLEEGGRRYRHWTPKDWTLYDHRGNEVERQDHPYGRPPIIRIFDKRRPRCKNVGMPRYEDICEIARESYNAYSEVILSGTHGAHPVVQGPEDYCQAGETIPMGPNNLLPMKKIGEGTVNESYVPFQVLAFDQKGADSLRQNVQDLLDMADLAGHLTKPAGASGGGTGSNVVAQSGISKQMDTLDGNQVLGDISETIERCDKQITELFLLVQYEGNPPDALLNAIEVEYPKDFDLFSPEQTAGLAGDYQQALQGTGDTPTADFNQVSTIYRKGFKGMPDEHYDAVDAEIKTAIARNAQSKAMGREAARAQLIGENQPAAADDDDQDQDNGGMTEAVSTGFGLQVTMPTV